VRQYQYVVEGGDKVRGGRWCGEEQLLMWG